MQILFQTMVRFITRESRLGGMLRLLLVIFVIFDMAVWSGSRYQGSEFTVASLFSLGGLLHWVFPLAALLAALLLAAHYIRDLYELPRYRNGLRYLLSVLFGIGLPVVRVDNGGLDLPEEYNPMGNIGGPGYISVAPGNLVLLEDLTHPSRIYSTGLHYVNRRESIKEVFSLEDRHGYIETLRATTRDGIAVVVEQVNYLYRLRPSYRTGRTQPRQPNRPFPFSPQAMRNYTYNRTVGPVEITSIDAYMDLAVGGEITSYISNALFDELTGPASGDEPRRMIQDQLASNAFKNRLENMGMELDWVDIGHFDVDDQRIWEERVNTWQAEWTGTANVEIAEGESRRLTFRRLARAEGRADALRTLIEALNDARLQGQPAQNLRNLMLLYTAQILEEMTDAPLGGKNQAGLPPPGGKK